MSEKRASMLVTGGSGFVGRMLCKELIVRGYRVRAAIRELAGWDADGCEPVKIFSVDSNTNWENALYAVDTVVHLAARVHVMHDDAYDPLGAFRRVNVEGTERLARSAAAVGVKRFVYVSSIKVNGEDTKDGVKFTEDDLPCPKDPYGVSKMEAEEVLKSIAQETGLEVVIVRPPLVYGIGVKGNFSLMLKMLSKNIPLPLASVRNLRSLIYVENLVDALIVCATHPAASGKTYLVSDGEDVSTPDLLRYLQVGMGGADKLFVCPLGLIKWMGRLFGQSDRIDRLLGSLRVDSGKIRRELGWSNPYALSEGLQKTGASARSGLNEK